MQASSMASKPNTTHLLPCPQPPDCLPRHLSLISGVGNPFQAAELTGHYQIIHDMDSVLTTEYEVWTTSVVQAYIIIRHFLLL